MALNIRRITTRFALLMALAAVVPLVAYGFISILSLQRGTRESVIAGNRNVVTRAAEEVRRYIVTNANLLKALSADLQNTGLDQRQKDQILKNYVLEFREYREVTLFDQSGAAVVSSRVGKPRLGVPTDDSRSVTLDGIVMSPIRVDDDLLPTSTFVIRLTHLNEPAGWLAGGINLEEMWQMVDRIRIGEHGFAMIVAPDGELIAHGDPDEKALVARGDNMGTHPLVAAARDAHEAVSAEYDNKLGAAFRIPELGWTVIVEQPAREAFANLVGAAAAAGDRDLARAARDGCGGLPVRPHLHQSDPAAEAGHAGRGVWRSRNPRAHRIEGRIRRARRRLQHDGGAARRTSRRTSRSKSGRRCSDAWRRDSSTTSSTRFRTSATTRGSCCATTSTRTRVRIAAASSIASSRPSAASWTTFATS